MNITRAWKKFAGCSCSHAQHVHVEALAAYERFLADYKPKFTFHLGDAFDTAALRNGAAGSSDEAASPLDDVESGIAHLNRLRPSIFLLGNHECRIWDKCNHPKAIVADLAKELRTKIEVTCRKNKTQLITYNGIWSGATMGPALLTHGTIYNENAARDMAEMYPMFKVVFFGHTHTFAVSQARTAARNMGVNVGCLKPGHESDYAKARRKTFSWKVAWVYGEYCDDDIQVNHRIYDSEEVKFPKAIGQ